MAKVVVIGAGASGIITALRLSESENEVILLEKNDKIGKKILVTGNGKCNLWNLNLLKNNVNLKDYYYTDNYDILNDIFVYSNKTYQYLTSDLGIFVKDKNNYVYPYSESAASIRETFERKLLNRNNIDVICNFEVTNIEKEDNKFKVYSKDEYYEADFVVISCGYKSSNLGTNSINNLVNNIEIIKPMPALVPITIDSPYLKKWNGIRTNAKLSLYNKNELIKSDEGEVQLTDYGLSGIVSLNLSSYINRLKDKDLTIKIDFMPDINVPLYFEILKYKNETIEEVFETIFNYKLMFVIFEYAKLNKDTLWNDLTEDDKNRLIDAITNFKLKPTGTLDFDRSQVTTGGISLNEINNRLESNNIKNLYYTGEILNVDGMCGGYNLAFAFITGYIVGSEINDKS